MLFSPFVPLFRMLKGFQTFSFNAWKGACAFYNAAAPSPLLTVAKWIWFLPMCESCIVRSAIKIEANVKGALGVAVNSFLQWRDASPKLYLTINSLFHLRGSAAHYKSLYWFLKSFLTYYFSLLTSFFWWNKWGVIAYYRESCFVVKDDPQRLHCWKLAHYFFVSLFHGFPDDNYCYYGLRITYQNYERGGYSPSKNFAFFL